MKWKKISKKTKHEEEFVGSLRAKMTKEARAFLKPLMPERRELKDNGLIFYYYPDGRVEVRSVYDTIREMVREIKEFRKGKNRGF